MVTRPLTKGETGWLLAAVFSPAVLLGIERGNTDLLIFFLLAGAIVTVPRGVAWSLALLAFVLKLYPLVAIAGLLRWGRPAVTRAFLVAGGLALLYLAYTFDDLVMISAGTPRDTWLSYGLNVLWMKVTPAQPALGAGLRVLSGIVALGAVLLAAVAGWRRKGPGGPGASRELDAFRVGVACYAGTFLLGNNFVYRLMFLLFTIPQLLSWAGRAADGHARPARIALVGIYGALWSLVLDRLLQDVPAGPWISFLLAAAAHWVVFVVLVYCFSSSCRLGRRPAVRRTRRAGRSFGRRPLRQHEYAVHLAGCASRSLLVGRGGADRVARGLDFPELAKAGGERGATRR